MNQRARTALVLATGLQRLVELRISSRNRARLGRAEQASPATYPAMVAAHVALFAVSSWPRSGRRVSRSMEVAALAGLAASAGLRLWVIRTLGASWNVTAHVPPDGRIETGGPYRYVRHPNYVAVALEFACLPIAVGACPEAVVLSLADAAVLAPRIRAEERLLDAIPGYREAFRGVPRFIPRPGRRSRQIPASDSQSRVVRSRNVRYPQLMATSLPNAR
ncbi:MAG TPA: isoprenylcysteine carboxylmethyltransferase family protein [Candidatus Saccharimonadales bacterium]|nr:isoprenylcysteine carboxylmethyltransferase family protein [Candidatus Saccharimonadales bacterium]